MVELGKTLHDARKTANDTKTNKQSAKGEDTEDDTPERSKTVTGRLQALPNGYVICAVPKSASEAGAPIPPSKPTPPNHDIRILGSKVGLFSSVAAFKPHLVWIDAGMETDQPCGCVNCAIIVAEKKEGAMESEREKEAEDVGPSNDEDHKETIAVRSETLNRQESQPNQVAVAVTGVSAVVTSVRDTNLVDNPSLPFSISPSAQLSLATPKKRSHLDSDSDGSHLPERAKIQQPQTHDDPCSSSDTLLAEPMTFGASTSLLEHGGEDIPSSEVQKSTTRPTKVAILDLIISFQIIVPP